MADATDHSGAPAEAPPAPANAAPGARATFAFMRKDAAHWLALGFGTGLAPWGPGTVGTLWAWVSFLVLDRWLNAAGWAILIGFGFALGIGACARTARHLGLADPGAIVWDEVLAFWIVLWLVMPAPWWAQLAAFALFRFFDITKPGPVRWADRLFEPRAGESLGWRQGLGIMLDDLVAAFCTLLFIALWVRLWNT